MFKIRNPFKPKNVNIAKVAALKQLQVIEALQKQVKNSAIKTEADRIEIFYLNSQLIAIKAINKTISDLVDNDLRLSRLEVIELQDQQLKDAHEIMALKSIISNLRKQKVYSGQKFYNPEDHKAPTVYLCARWNDWYVVRQSNHLTPILITAEQWKETYGHLVVIPQMNSNLKNLN